VSDGPADECAQRRLVARQFPNPDVQVRLAHRVGSDALRADGREELGSHACPGKRPPHEAFGDRGAVVDLLLQRAGERPPNVAPQDDPRRAGHGRDQLLHAQVVSLEARFVRQDASGGQRSAQLAEKFRACVRLLFARGRLLSWQMGVAP
jgi:hypothetical protein